MKTFFIVIAFVSSSCVTVPRVTLPARPASGDAVALAGWREAVQPAHVFPAVTPEQGHLAQPQFLILNNGQRVVHPADLLSVVSPTSRTAQFVQNFIEAEERSQTMEILSFVGMGASMVGLGTGTITLANRNTNAGLAVMGGATVVALLTLIPSLIGANALKRMAAARHDAFHAYAADIPKPPEVSTAPADSSRLTPVTFAVWPAHEKTTPR